MAVNTKITVDVSGLKRGISEAVASVKTIDAALKKNEAQFKAAGDSEQYMANKAEFLRQKLQQQKSVITNTSRLLEDMNKRNVSQTSVEYQKLAKNLLEAEAAMAETEAALNNLSASQDQAADSADKLTKSVNNIGKKVSLDQVIGGINSITSGLENAAKKAVSLGEAIWTNIMDSAMLADDTATQAMILGMSIEQYQQYKGVFDTIAEMTIADWSKAKRKVQKALNDPSTEQMDALSALGFVTYGKYGESSVTHIADNWEDGLWVLAEELRRRVESGQISDDMADIYGEALFGKNYSSMKPFLSMGKEGFAAALGTINTATSEAVEKDAALHDAVIKLTGSYEALKEQIVSGFAPALTDAANALDSLLGKILDYLKTDEGAEMLERLGTAVSGLFEDLGNIDPEDVVENFVTMFEKVVNSFEWLSDNWGDVKAALLGIAAGFGALKIATMALNIQKVIDGFTSLLGSGAESGGGGETTAEAAATGGKKVLPLLSKTAQTLYAADPTGSLALIPQVFEDQTTFGRHLRNGGSLQEAAEASVATIKASAEEGIGNFLDYFATQLPDAFWGALGFEGAEDAASKFEQNLKAADEFTFGDDMTAEEAMALINGETEAQVTVEPVAEDGAAEDVAEQVGPVTLPALLDFKGWTPNSPDLPYYGGENGFANGLSMVPNNGLYLLHKGEQVVPAREVGSRSYSSNLYVENMNMHNGMDAAGLAAAMSAAQRRMLSGYGS